VKTKKKKKRDFHSLTVTLAITFSAFIIVVLLISSGLQMYFGFKAQKKGLVTHQHLIAKDAANTVEGFIREKFSTLEAVASRGNLAIIPKEAYKSVLERLLGIEPAFRQLALLNDQNQELEKVSRLSNLVSYEFIKQIDSALFSHVKRGEIYIGSVYIDEITSEPLVIMAVPVTDVFGDLNGTLIAEANLKFMWDLVGALKIGNNGLAYVVNKQGKLIASGDIGRVLKGENLIYLNEVNEFVTDDTLTHKDTAEIVKGIQGNHVVANHAHLGTPDWAVVVELPVLEAYKNLITTLIISGLIMLLSFALAVSFGVFLSKRITKPIIKLRDAAVQIGKGKLDTQIEIETKNEIEDLAKALNQMTKDLQKTTTSIDNLNREITERMKAEKRQAQLLRQLEKTNQELREFVYMASHDLKAPLRGINTLANWISSDYADKLDEQGKKQLALLSRRVDRMRNLIEGIIQCSRVGHIQEEKTWMNLNKLVREVIEMLDPPENITITVENELPTIKCERIRFIHVFQNLINNAIKYMDKPQGKIEIGCVEQDDFWKFSVADNGPGIKEKYFEKIFQMFQTLLPRDEFESTGVGLTLVKKIVELYEGKIWVESKAGMGSTFFFILPKQEKMDIKNANFEVNITH